MATQRLCYHLVDLGIQLLHGHHHEERPIIVFVSGLAMKRCCKEGESTLRWPKMLSQILFLKFVQRSTSTKAISKENFINYTQNKVLQLPNNAIVKGNYILKINIKRLKSIFVKK
jgi:hypothetical protein